MRNCAPSGRRDGGVARRPPPTPHIRWADSTFAAARGKSCGPGSGHAPAVRAALLRFSQAKRSVLVARPVRCVVACGDRHNNPARRLFAGQTPWRIGFDDAETCHRLWPGADRWWHGDDCSPLPIGQSSRLHGRIPMAVAGTAAPSCREFSPAATRKRGPSAFLAHAPAAPKFTA